MKSFLEYLKEYEEQLEEDAIIAPNSGSIANAEVVSPSNATNTKAIDVAKPNAVAALTDNSVLGKKKHKDSGFFGKNDFQIPQNVLSIDYQRKNES